MSANCPKILRLGIALTLVALYSIALHFAALCTVHCALHCTAVHSTVRCTVHFTVHFTLLCTAADPEVCGLPPGSQGAPSCGGLLVILLPPAPLLIIPITRLHHSIGKFHRKENDDDDGGSRHLSSRLPSKLTCVRLSKLA